MNFSESFNIHKPLSAAKIQNCQNLYRYQPLVWFVQEEKNYFCEFFMKVT